MVVASLTAAGNRYTVVREPMDDDGETRHSHRLIVVAKHVPCESTGEVLTHEYLHALIHDSGAQHYLEGVLGDHDVTTVVETLVRILSPHLCRDWDSVDEAKRWTSSPEVYL